MDNHYTALPSLLEQHQAMEPTFTAPFTVLRLLTPRDTKYDDAVKVYGPYDNREALARYAAKQWL